MYVIEIHWKNTNRIDTITLENIRQLKQYQQMIDNEKVEKVNIFISITNLSNDGENFTDKIIDKVKKLETENNLKYRRELLNKARRY